MIGDLPLFSSAARHRTDDHATSIAASQQVTAKLAALQRAVLDAVATAPDGLTDRELEQLPQFAHYGPSTVQKRRSELFQAGYLRHASTRNGLMVWVIVPGVTW